jgi:FMN hydrolase / 5-amino-6-(5-phospho-D-ribitylamino)uracil phosphatase
VSGGPNGRWVCLDVGETLIDETRIWSLWADALGIPRLTFMAALGALIERGGEHGSMFSVFGIDESEWRALLPSVEQRYGGFQEADLYPDARPALEALTEAGYRVSVLANQPASRTGELRALGIRPEVMAMSDEMGVAKPAPAFFSRALELMGSPDPGAVAYVGDRVDNDVLASMAAGMRAVWIRRGPWGIIQAPPRDHQPALTVGSLTELTERIDQAWTDGSS